MENGVKLLTVWNRSTSLKTESLLASFAYSHSPPQFLLLHVCDQTSPFSIVCWEIFLCGQTLKLLCTVLKSTFSALLCGYSCAKYDGAMWCPCIHPFLPLSVGCGLWRGFWEDMLDSRQSPKRPLVQVPVFVGRLIGAMLHLPQWKAYSFSHASSF